MYLFKAKTFSLIMLTKSNNGKSSKIRNVCVQSDVYDDVLDN